VENVLKNVWVRRGAVILGLILVAIGFGTGMRAVRISGWIVAAIGFISGGGL
jgi:hypothetical protein